MWRDKSETTTFFKGQKIDVKANELKWNSTKKICKNKIKWIVNKESMKRSKQNWSEKARKQKQENKIQQRQGI